MNNPLPRLTAAEAASHISHLDTVAFSGFTAAGAAKVVPQAIADRAREVQAAGGEFRIGVITGASTCRALDGALAQADAVLFRTPYQADPDMRQRINAGHIAFFDMHLSMLPQALRYGFLGPIRYAVIEACDVTPSGEITLTSSVGGSPTFCRLADKIIIELNRFHPAALHGLHDVYEPESPPCRQPIPLLRASDRIGRPFIKVPPEKILGIVETDVPDQTASFGELSPITARIGENVANFLAAELRIGRIPKTFLPLQSGVGDTANAVFRALGEHPEIPSCEMYTEVIQDAAIALLKTGKLRFASGCSLTVSNPLLREIYANLEFFRSRLILRPQEISNNPEIIRRLGVISVNTALETDLAGNVNSTHVLGRSLMNGIGGSGDFARSAYLSIFTCQSTAKDGRISTIVPLVSHHDHSEHCVQVIITEQGVADLRGKSPAQRAQTIIQNCVHPEYREILRQYLAMAGKSHSPHTLRAAFNLHEAYAASGDMRKVCWSTV